MNISSSVMRPVVVAPSYVRPVLSVAGWSFDEAHWKDCFLFFLEGVWSGDGLVMREPAIWFGRGVHLKLDPQTDTYSAVNSMASGPFPEYLYERTLVVDNSRAQVEQGLMRFVKNDRIELLVIVLKEGQILFWKSNNGSQLGVAFKDVPSLLELTVRAHKQAPTPR